MAVTILVDGNNLPSTSSSKYESRQKRLRDTQLKVDGWVKRLEEVVILTGDLALVRERRET